MKLARLAAVVVVTGTVVVVAAIDVVGADVAGGLVVVVRLLVDFRVTSAVIPTAATATIPTMATTIQPLRRRPPCPALEFSSIIWCSLTEASGYGR
jgi:hypothetical protein